MTTATVDDLVAYAWRRGTLSYKLWDQQLPIYESIRGLPPHTDPVVILCARQFGKSVLGALLAVEDCLRHDEVAVLIVGPSIEQTVGIVNQSLQVIQKDAPEGLIKRAKAESQWYIGSSELIIGGFDVRMASRKRGRRLHRIYLEELVDSHPDDYEEALRSDLGPALTHSTDGSMISLSTLPRIGDHPFITKTIPQAKLNNAFYSYTIDDNKALSQQQYDACVKRCGGRDTIAFRREYLNEVIRDPSIVVVPTFNKATHVAQFEAPLETKWNVMIDWGGVRDKTAALLMTYSFMDDVDIVWQEKVWGPNTSTDRIVEELRQWEREYEITARIADVPGQLAVDLNQSFGYYVVSPQKSDWQSSVNQMVARFAQDKVRVHKRCQFTTLSLESGVLNRNKNDFDRSEALGHCDALAALMYGLRCLDRTSPWGKVATSRDNSFVMPKADPNGELASSITGGKVFGGSKRFGSFR